MALLTGVFAGGSADGDGAAPSANDTSTPDGGGTRGEDTDAGTDASSDGDGPGDAAPVDGRAPALSFVPSPPLSLGRQTACARLSPTATKCWGLNNYSQLGQNDNAHRGDDPGEMVALAPIVFGGGRTAVAVDAGHEFTCAVLDDGSVRCWGRNEYAQLGQGTATLQENKPTDPSAVPAVTLGPAANAVAVSAGFLFGCALLSDGAVKCWGLNAVGQLGQGDATNRMTKAQLDVLAPIVLGGKAVQIATGDTHACALLADGSVKCWGHGAAIGQETTEPIGKLAGDMAALQPVFLGAGRTAKAISAGGTHTCVLLDDGDVKCWGTNIWGELGQDDDKRWGESPGDMAALQPVFLGAGHTAKAISAGATHTCAILDDGTVKCWGDNTWGQLGQDDMKRRGRTAGDMAALQPVVLGAGRTAKHVSAGSFFTCAWLDDDSIKCWGYNNAGELGQGDRVNRGDKAGDMASLKPIAF